MISSHCCSFVDVSAFETASIFNVTFHAVVPAIYVALNN